MGVQANAGAEKGELYITGCILRLTSSFFLAHYLCDDCLHKHSSPAGNAHPFHTGDPDENLQGNFTIAIYQQTYQSLGSLVLSCICERTTSSLGGLASNSSWFLPNFSVSMVQMNKSHLLHHSSAPPANKHSKKKPQD